MKLSRKDLEKNHKGNKLILSEKDYSYDLIILSLRKINRFCKKNDLKCVLISTKKREINSLEDLSYAINCTSRREQISYIYDKVCDYLDSDFLVKNKCKFKNNKCISDRNKKYSKDCGCCRAKSGELCKYLDKDHCTIKNLGCKFFVCPTLKKQGIKYKTNDFYLLKYFCNFREKVVLRYTIFVPKEDVIERILTHRW